MGSKLDFRFEIIMQQRRYCLSWPRRTGNKLLRGKALIGAACTVFLFNWMSSSVLYKLVATLQPRNYYLKHYYSHTLVAAKEPFHQNTSTNLSDSRTRKYQKKIAHCFWSSLTLNLTMSLPNVHFESTTIRIQPRNCIPTASKHSLESHNFVKLTINPRHQASQPLSRTSKAPFDLVCVNFTTGDPNINSNSPTLLVKTKRNDNTTKQLQYNANSKRGQ